MAKRLRHTGDRARSRPVLPMRVAPATRSPAPEAGRWTVVDDLARPVPVGRAELEVLERHLGSTLDALLREIKR